MPTRSPKSDDKEKKPRAPRKPRAAATLTSRKKKEAVEKADETPVVLQEQQPAEHKTPAHKPAHNDGRYIFATGRRKTAVANVRLFAGRGESTVNKKPLNDYFSYSYFQDEVLLPLQRTGQHQNYYFTATINGGGPHSQAQALRHGLATALGQINDDTRKVLKKNGFLTRDDRKKERKKPGLHRARRAPQWAKR